jgi:hypothetical protein
MASWRSVEVAVKEMQCWRQVSGKSAGRLQQQQQQNQHLVIDAMVFEWK